jgi:thiaminase/transcriptional activator TenA
VVHQRERFSDELWRSAVGICEAIFQHPFVRGLADGSLPRDRFLFYVIQDSLYLTEYARALSIAAAKAPDGPAIATFNRHATSALEVEMQLHEQFFQEYGLAPAEVRKTPMAPTNLAYTRYLLGVAYERAFDEIVAALLPCYWIYWEVGKALAARGSPAPLYHRWIDAYAADSFGSLVTIVRELTDRAAEATSESSRERMREHFLTTSRYEWMFWDMGWRCETWPI